jgi:hypothetical protein
LGALTAAHPCRQTVTRPRSQRFLELGRLKALHSQAFGCRLHRLRLPDAAAFHQAMSRFNAPLALHRDGHGVRRKRRIGSQPTSLPAESAAWDPLTQRQLRFACFSDTRRLGWMVSSAWVFLYFYLLPCWFQHSHCNTERFFICFSVVA